MQGGQQKHKNKKNICFVPSDIDFEAQYLTLLFQRKGKLKSEVPWNVDEIILEFVGNGMVTILGANHVFGIDLGLGASRF